MEAPLKEKTKQGVMVVLAVAAIVYYVICLVSYSPLDDEYNSYSFPPAAPSNLGGSVGAWISSFTIYFLGVGAIFVPLPFLVLLRLFHLHLYIQ